MSQQPVKSEKLSFDPQFHTKITEGVFAGSWMAVPRPSSAVSLKTNLYGQWQQEERVKLIKAGQSIVDIKFE